VGQSGRLPKLAMPRNRIVTIKEVAKKLEWGISTTYRYFEQVEDVIIKPGGNIHGRTKRLFTVPDFVLERERKKMGNRGASVVDTADQRMRELKRLKKPE
jgi:transposase